MVISTSANIYHIPGTPQGDKEDRTDADKDRDEDTYDNDGVIGNNSSCVASVSLSITLLSDHQPLVVSAPLK